MERCTRVLISDPEERKGKWRELMPEAKEVFLELGCGKGRFTAETAAQNPQALYIAVERVPDAMVIAMERVCAQELHNVFFVDGDVAQLPLFFAPGEVDRIYINFCDPWPSNRHAKRRLTHPDNAGAGGGLPAALPAGAGRGGGDPLQDRQPGSIRVVPVPVPQGGLWGV